MSFDMQRRTEKLLEEISSRIDESYLQGNIEGPIRRAAESFEYDRNEAITHERFVSVTSAFVAHLYKYGMAVPQRLTDSQARSEMIAVLEKGYRNPHAHGYYAAYLDALDPHLNGLESVLVRIAEIVILAARERYIKWVCRCRIDPSDWMSKCKLAGAILRQFRSDTSPPLSLSESPPAQFAEHIPDLISAIRSIEKNLRDMRESGIDWFDNETEQVNLPLIR